MANIDGKIALLIRGLDSIGLATTQLYLMHHVFQSTQDEHQVSIFCNKNCCSFLCSSFVSCGLKDRRIRVNACSPDFTDTPRMNNMENTKDASQNIIENIEKMTVIGRFNP